MNSIYALYKIKSKLTELIPDNSYWAHFWDVGELFDSCWSASIVGVVGGVKECSDDIDSLANLRFFNGVT